MSNFIDISTSMTIRFCSVIVFSPLFVIPGSTITILGGLCGHVYMRAQLCAKREMSNAKAPVLGHFGAAIAGLSAHFYSLLGQDLILIRFHSCIWSSRSPQKGVLQSDQQVHPSGGTILQPQPVSGPHTMTRHMLDSKRNRWICVRLDCLGALFVALLAAYLVYGGGVGASRTGFSVTMAGMWE